MRVEGDREELMAAGAAAWAKLCAVRGGADPEVALHDPDSPEWTSRDVYTHFLRMHSGSARAIRTELEKGERDHWSGLDELNERHVAEASFVSHRGSSTADERGPCGLSGADDRADRSGVRGDQTAAR